MTIQLDLRDLTQEHFRECMNGEPSACRYSSPCIIGSLMTTEQRAIAAKSEWDGLSIGLLVDEGTITFPADQVTEARLLQNAFDRGNYATVQQLCEPWFEQEVPA